MIRLLASAAFGQRYPQPAAQEPPDVAVPHSRMPVMLIMVVFTVPVLIWPVILASAASAARPSFTTRALRAVLTG